MARDTLRESPSFFQINWIPDQVRDDKTERTPIQDAPIVQKVYDLYRTCYPVIEKMPKRDKYTLGERISANTLIVLECLIAASYAPRERKLALLQQATIKLDVLKMLLRLAEDVGSIPTKAYLKLTEQLTEIGRMLGGWIRSIK